jgi:signal transduction histidine kinase
LVQKITVLSLELSLMDGSLSSEQELSRTKIAEKVKELAQIVAELIQSLRRMKSRLRPKVLDEYGLGAALEWASAEFSNRTGLKYRIKTPQKELLLSPHGMTELYRMFQEILCNIEKHAQAEHVEIELRQEPSHLVLRVSDDGKEMTQEQIVSSKSLGLIELRERAFSLRGEVTVTGTLGKGTTVTVKVPRDPSASA